jgi:short-subunit dehydrogenase
MRSQKSGYIINIGSVAGFVGAPGWSVYSATKAAVAAFSERLGGYWPGEASLIGKQTPPHD